MKKIGGYFPYETLLEKKNEFLEGLCPENGDLRYLMSGRCAIYYALKDYKYTDKRCVAYVPIYTCETVLAPFHKAGYTLLFYDFDENMNPVFDPAVLDQISIISICGYYGFSTYNREFVAECSRRGICIIEDTTHSIFSSDGIDPHCDYVVGSLRKWIGVAAGGFAIKTKGKFLSDPQTPHEKHLAIRKQCLDLKNHLEERSDEELEQIFQQGDALFWDAEMMLRQIFDSFGSDPESVFLIQHYPVEALKTKRRANYRYLLDHVLPSDKFRIVFPTLPEGTVPSHFTLFASDRDTLRAILLQHEIGSTTYWPVGPLVNLENHPNAQYIYDHVLSIPCDQRYGEKDMQKICDTLNSLQ